MAFEILKFRLSVNIADNSGEQVRRSYEVPEGVVADYDEFIAIVPALITALDAMTSGLITGYQTEVVFINDTFVLPGSGVENENQAFFSGKIVGDPTSSATMSIPAADPAIFVSTSGPGANIVDMADAAVVAWIGLFDGAPGWGISDGEAWVTSTVSGRRRHTKNSNG